MKRRKHPSAKSRHGRSEQASRSDQAAVEPSRYYFHAFRAVIAAGIVIRVVVFVYMGYFNNDDHLSVLEYVSRYWFPPHAAQFNQAYHPPLYYFLAALFFRWGNLPAVQGLSLLLSIATLMIIALLLRQLAWVNERIKPWCLALPAFHPQFIMFSLFISNDTLAIFLGALIFYLCRRLQLTPSFSNHCLLAIGLGLGLLTKAVFLVFVAPLLLFIWMTGRRQALPAPRLLWRLASFFAIASLLGSYKYVENFILFGSPTVSNLDLWRWTAEQRPTWIGVRSLFDVNILKLVRDPVVSTSTVHSYPLMIYGSFWYSLIPESTFHGNLIAPFNRLGSMIYLAALGPSFLMAVGASRVGMETIRWGFRTTTERNPSHQDRIIYESTLLLTVLLNFFLIVSVGWRYDVWSVFQGRLLFPSYFALILVLSAGMEWAASSRLKSNIFHCFMLALMLSFLAYIIIEIWLAVLYPVDPLSMNHMPYQIDMNAR
ncbi:MAG: glycosyltransferase family 39 protein [Deltaproteobacteria bacterium]|nr:glycosyltransferase family 39 protein [Deltaproteobacteria bacterium]